VGDEKSPDTPLSGTSANQNQPKPAITVTPAGAGLTTSTSMGIKDSSVVIKSASGNPLPRSVSATSTNTLQNRLPAIPETDSKVNNDQLLMTHVLKPGSYDESRGLGIELVSVARQLAENAFASTDDGVPSMAVMCNYSRVRLAVYQGDSKMVGLDGVRRVSFRSLASNLYHSICLCRPAFKGRVPQHVKPTQPI